MKVFVTAKRSGTRAPLYSWQIETDSGAIIAASIQMHADINKCVTEFENVKKAIPLAKIVKVAPVEAAPQSLIPRRP